jgi:hypothetical protein
MEVRVRNVIVLLELCVLKSQNGKMLYYELEVWSSSKGSWRRNRASLVGSWRITRACLVVSVGSVSACPLIVGPCVELLCCSISGSWDSNREK